MNIKTFTPKVKQIMSY